MGAGRIRRNEWRLLLGVNATYYLARIQGARGSLDGEYEKKKNRQNIKEKSVTETSDRPDYRRDL